MSDIHGDKTIGDFMIASGKMEGLNSNDMDDVKKAFKDLEIDFDSSSWELSDNLCIDVITRDKGYGGKKLTDAMREDMIKNASKYNNSGGIPIGKENKSIDPERKVNYRKNPVLMQFFKNTERLEVIPEPEKKQIKVEN